MNEATTRAELIDPKLKECGWGVEHGSRIHYEYNITAGKIRTGGRGRKQKADYVLEYKGVKLAVVEAKSVLLDVGEGVMQAKEYAHKLQLAYTFSTNGNEIYQICMATGEEKLISDYPTPQELWDKTFANNSANIDNEEERAKLEHIEKWRERLANVPFEDKGGTWQPRYYQEIAVRRTIEAIVQGQKRILLTLATGTGKTSIAFQIAWKLFQTRWTLQQDGSRRPRILFLADRNILADQAYNSFSAFPEDAMIRISPKEISKSGRVPTNGSIFFTIFQTLMTESTQSKTNIGEYSDTYNYAAAPKEQYSSIKYNFSEYPQDFFDLIIIDECHRGGANDESSWRAIMDYFSPAVQIGLTATPKRDDNVDTYSYFGEPVYVYSLKEGINDGFLTPFKVKRIRTTLDDYRYTSDDTVLDGEIDEDRIYEEKDFNRIIEIKQREENRVNIYLDDANQNEKAIAFCANQAHAALIRDMINQNAEDKNPFYCVRVTANDGEIGEVKLREFQDNEKTIPTILTTSHKLSTGVDARNIRNIVLLRPVNSMIEFKQIIGRGTRTFEGKEFFTIYDYVDAYKHFSDPEWDGEPTEIEICKVCEKDPCECEYTPPKPCKVCGQRPCVCPKPEPEPCKDCGQSPCECNKFRKIEVRLSDGKVRELKHMIDTSFWSAEGRPISAEEFLSNLFGELPKLFRDEDELRRLWSNPITRKTLLERLDDAGFPREDLVTLQKLTEMEDSDLYDVLKYIFDGNYIALTREERAQAAESNIFALLDEKQRDFISFVLSKYVEAGVDELSQDKLPILLKNKYQSFEDAKKVLGDEASISKVFIEFQKHLYGGRIA